jgi:hypothetical protein
MRKHYQHRSKEERSELRDTRLAEANDRLQAGVADLLAEDGEWRKFLTFQAKLHNYSFGNTMLIREQYPEATMVMGYGNKEGTTGWKSIGRHVRSREDNEALGIRPDGIWILAPFSGKRTERDLSTGEDVERRFTYFKPVTVFDISQTDGEPIPEPQQPVLLEGDSEELRDRFLALQDALKADGWTVRIVAKRELGKAEADASPATRTIRVRDDVSDAEALASLVHEVAHVYLGHTDDLAEYSLHRGRAEAEAESTAFLVLAGLDVDTSGYTLPYVAGWSEGNPKIVQDVGERVVKAARELLERLDGDRELVDA